MTRPIPTPQTHSDTDWLRLVQRKLDHLRYGVVQLTVHDGRVVQVDCTERTRLASGQGGDATAHRQHPPTT